MKTKASSATSVPRKPAWIRIKAPVNTDIHRVKQLLRTTQLTTVCEEADCPNLTECFSCGTATFMILGDRCTRRCPFCDVAHGIPAPPDHEEPDRLATAIAALQLRYVVITSVTRDDLRDGGASHFVACAHAARQRLPELGIELLVPDFRGRQQQALACFETLENLNVFNHNIETVPRLYRNIRPGADYDGSLTLLKQFKARYPQVTTKSGLMIGFGETHDEILATMQDLRAHDCDRLTIGQYLQPSRYHVPVQYYWTPDQFAELADQGQQMGFEAVMSGPLVRSSYHADQQAHRTLDSSM
jgi:lipoic acid synthetase